MNNKILATALFVVALACLFAPVPKADAQTVSTANHAFPLPVTDTPWTIAADPSTTTYSLTTNAGVLVTNMTTLPVGTKILRVLAASGAYHFGSSSIKTDTTGKYPSCAEDAYIDFKVNPLSPNSLTLYFCNAATDTGTLLRFHCLR